MATVELRFSALPAHVRTARLVAASVARRTGVDDSLLDEVRLAVGEACSRAVGMHVRAGLNDPVAVRLHADGDRFSVEVADVVPPQARAVVAPEDVPAQPAVTLLEADQDELSEALGLALISGLVDDVEIVPGTDGVVVRMSWPADGG